jgi:hypothetical protein
MISAGTINALEMLAPFTVIWPLVRGRVETLCLIFVVMIVGACLPIDSVGTFAVIGTGTIWIHYFISLAWLDD